MRNPWGIQTGYSADWSKYDARWNSLLKSQVPLGIDPTTWDMYGYFVVPIKYFINGECFYDYQIGHQRKDEGYKTEWYDAENIDEQFH